MLGYSSAGKRVGDFVLSFMAITVFSPLLVALYLVVRWKLGSPVLFRQQRVGLNGEVFQLLKFRSMTNEKNEQGELLSDAERLTPFGRWLRSTSLDELPELWNVLRGEMSLVGPRPLLVEYLPLYSEEQARRHLVRPGLTGLAQVEGRNACEWNERLAWDVRYVENMSLRIDAWILCRTVGCVLGRQGVSAEGHVSMPRFTGNQSVDSLSAVKRAA